MIRDLLQVRSVNLHGVELEGAGHVPLPAEENRLAVIVQVGIQYEPLVTGQDFPQHACFGVEHEEATARSVVFLVVGIDVRALDHMTLHEENVRESEILLRIRCVRCQHHGAPQFRVVWEEPT